MRPSILILHASGTNRDREAAWACELAGGLPCILHVNELINGRARLQDHQMLLLPGGFSYGDDLGAGKLWAVKLRYQLAGQLEKFVAAGRPVLGICNGFQVLVKTGLLPGLNGQPATGRANTPTASLIRNDSGRFECRWVRLEPDRSSPCVFTRELSEPIYCPVAHGEGKFVVRDAEMLGRMKQAGQVALRYSSPDGAAADYPHNPNGSQDDIAGICNPDGTVLGLMPHPEDHLTDLQHPGYHRSERGMSGLELFRAGIRYAAQL